MISGKGRAISKRRAHRLDSPRRYICADFDSSAAKSEQARRNTATNPSLLWRGI